MKRAKRLYALLGILAVVSVLTFCVLNYQEKQEEIKASGEVVLSIDPEEVTAFSWEYEALDPLSFHKDESWTYDEDSTFPVDEGQITSLLEQFRNFSAAFIIEKDVYKRHIPCRQPTAAVRAMAVRTKAGFLRSWRTIHRVSATQHTAMRQTSQKRMGSSMRPSFHSPSLVLEGVRPQATMNSNTPPAYQRTPRT